MKNRGRKRNSGGIRIEKPRVQTAGNAFASRLISCAFLSALGGFGAFGCFYSGFSFSFSMLPAAVVIIAASLFLTALFSAGRYRLPCAAVLAAVFAWAGYLLRTELGIGFRCLANGIIRVYTEHSSFDMVQMGDGALTEAAMNRAAALTAAYVMAIVVFLMVLFLTAKKRRYFLSIIITIPFFAASLVVGVVPDYGWILALILFWAMLVCDGGALRGAALAVLPAAFAAILLAIGLLFPRDSYERPDLIEDLRVGLLNGSDLTGMFRGGGIAGSANRVDLASSGNLNFSGDTVLMVRTAKTQVDYLKGFVGSVYTGTSWEPLSEDAYTTLSSGSGDWRVQNYPYLFSQIMPTSDDYELYAYDLTVRNVGTNPRCIYVPYGLINLPEELSQISFVNDTVLRSDNSLFGTQEYRMQGLSSSPSYPYMTLYYRVWMQLLRNESGFSAYMYGIPGTNGEVGTGWEVPQEILSLLSEEQQEFIRTVEAYENFVYENYLQVPENLTEFLNGYLGAHGLTLENYRYQAALVDAVVEQIQSENTYTLSPGVTPEGRDFVEYFLSENHQGYCRHFASAAALLLRAAGVPARYVEGYAVSPNGEKDENGWILLPDSSAHAWVEVYISGVGWQPVETTGSVRDDLFPDEEAADEETEAETETAGETAAAESTAGSGAETESSGEETGEETVSISLRTSLRGLLAILGAAVCLSGAGLWLNRRVRIRRRRKQFARKNRNQAVLAVYSYMAELRGLMEEPDGTEAPDATEAPGGTEAPDGTETPGGTEEEWKRFEEIALKARFSRHPSTREELRVLLAGAGRYRRAAEQQLKGMKKLYARYVRGLF